MRLVVVTAIVALFPLALQGQRVKVRCDGQPIPQVPAEITDEIVACQVATGNERLVVVDLTGPTFGSLRNSVNYTYSFATGANWYTAHVAWLLEHSSDSNGAQVAVSDSQLTATQLRSLLTFGSMGSVAKNPVPVSTAPRGTEIHLWLRTVSQFLARASTTRWESHRGSLLRVYVLQRGALDTLRKPVPTSNDPKAAEDTAILVRAGAPDVEVSEDDRVTQLTSDMTGIVGGLGGVLPVPGNTAALAEQRTADSSFTAFLNTLSAQKRDSLEKHPQKKKLIAPDTIVATGYRYYLTKTRATLNVNVSAGGLPGSSDPTTTVPNPAPAGGGHGGGGGRGQGNGGMSAGDSTGSASSGLTLTTGPAERAFLSLNLELSDISEARFDSASMTIKPGYQPTRVLLGLNMALTDVQEDDDVHRFWGTPYLGVYAEASSRPSNQFGFVLGLRKYVTLTSLVFPYVGFGGIRQDVAINSADSSVVTHVKWGWSFGVALNVTAAVGLLSPSGGGNKASTGSKGGGH